MGKKKGLETESERFLFICQKSGLSQAAFGASLGLSRSQVSHILSGRTKPSREVLDKLVSLYGVNLNWFLSGVGTPQEAKETAFIDLVYQEAAAGKGITIEDYAEVSVISIPQALIRPYSPSKLKAVFVSGDSMIGEKIFDGDIVVFCPHLTTGTAVYVVSVGDTLLVKRVSFDKTSQSITLIGANPSYSSKVISRKDLGNVKIEGRVVACLHRM
jgi:SOS-response transcriptional repressor LexA